MVSKCVFGTNCLSVMPLIEDEEGGPATTKGIDFLAGWPYFCPPLCVRQLRKGQRVDSRAETRSVEGGDRSHRPFGKTSGRRSVLTERLAGPGPKPVYPSPPDPVLERVDVGCCNNQCLQDDVLRITREEDGMCCKAGQIRACRLNRTV